MPASSLRTLAFGAVLGLVTGASAIQSLPARGVERYEGEFCSRRHCRQGFGTMIFLDGTSYAGEWKKDMQQGRGELFLSNGSMVFSGMFVANERHGDGVEYDATSGRVRYDGQYRHNQRNGRGVEYYDDGSRYEGNWAAGLQQGHGVLFNAAGEKMYSGNWERGEPHGYGCEYIEGEDVRFEGFFKRGLWSGKGTLYRMNGSRLEGFWVGSLLHGWAAVRLPGGDRYGGRFRKGKLQGPVVYHPAEEGDAAAYGYEGSWSIFQNVRQSIKAAETSMSTVGDRSRPSSTSLSMGGPGLDDFDERPATPLSLSHTPEAAAEHPAFERSAAFGREPIQRESAAREPMGRASNEPGTLSDSPGMYAD